MSWGALGSAAAGMAGSSFGAGFQYLGSKRLAEQQRAWAQKMYRNRYRWTMEDMQKAGLNPILAAQGGLTGSTPSGASGSMGMPSFANPVNAAQQFQLTKAEIERSRQTGREHKARADLAELGKVRAAAEADFYGTDRGRAALGMTETTGKGGWALAASMYQTLKKNMANAQDWLFQQGASARKYLYPKPNLYKLDHPDHPNSADEVFKSGRFRPSPDFRRNRYRGDY